MTMVVKSKYSLSQYINLGFGFLFLIAIVFMLLKMNLWENTPKLPIPNIVAIFILFLLTLLLFYTQLKKAPLIIVTDSSIIFKKFLFLVFEINKNSIRSINLFSPGRVLGDITMVTKIELENDEFVFIADRFYSNIDRLKLALSENFKEKVKPYYTKKTERSGQTDFEEYSEKYAGNPITSLNGILFFGIMIMLVITVLSKIHSLQPAHFFLITPIIMFYLGLGWQLNYFLISNKRLIVKNHFLFWIKREFDINNIIVVNFEHPHKRSMALRITTKDFKSKMFSAGSLRDKHWIQIKEKLERSGITII